MSEKETDKADQTAKIDNLPVDEAEQDAVKGGYYRVQVVDEAGNR